MSDEQMLYCLLAFVLGWLVSRQMGNGFSVGGIGEACSSSIKCKNDNLKYPHGCCAKSKYADLSENGICVEQKSRIFWNQSCIEENDLDN